MVASMAHDWLLDLAGDERLDRHGHSRLQQAARSEVSHLVAALSPAQGDTDNPGLDRALACYDAAALLVAERDGRLDMLGAIVLAREGRTALADGDPYPLPVCQVHPVHGPAVRRPKPGQRSHHNMPHALCATCKRCSRRERDERALLVGGVPYYRTHGFWASVGFGAVDKELPARVLEYLGVELPADHAAALSMTAPRWGFLPIHRRAVGSALPVFALADTANAAQVRRQAQEAVIAFGEELEDAQPSAGLERALDAYQAAAEVMDAATSLADLAGVLVLVNLGRGGPPLCFFNPLHGPSVREVTWRLIGTRERLVVPACDRCRDAIGRHRPPEVLADTVNNKHVPYFDVDPERSVWATTGFGCFCDDLVERILRGDLHHRRKAD